MGVLIWIDITFIIIANVSKRPCNAYGVNIFCGKASSTSFSEVLAYVVLMLLVAVLIILIVKLTLLIRKKKQ